jgi:uncharacterized protein (TIGR04255 family)
MPTTDQLPAPFSGPPPQEVPLARAPLVRVLAQIRFPTVLSVADTAAVAPFQERIRHAYPIGAKELIQRLEVSAETAQPVKAEAENIWRFQDRERNWRVSLAPTFLALECIRYPSRRDFLERMTNLVTALEQTLNPQVTQRIGLRYIDRIEGDSVALVHDLIKAKFLGSEELFAQAANLILTHAQLRTAEGATITARWGMLPPNTTIDPSVLEPVEGKSWILDLDIFVETQEDFTAAALGPRLESFAERIYAVFRFMVTDAFLTHYGRQP